MWQMSVAFTYSDEDIVFYLSKVLVLKFISLCLVRLNGCARGTEICKKLQNMRVSAAGIGCWKRKITR